MLKVLPLAIAVLLPLLSVLPGQEAGTSQGIAPVASPAPGRHDSSLTAARRVRDSILGDRRRKVDSITAADRASSRSRAPRRGGPFDEYTWAFYGNLAAGAIMGILAMLLRHRDAAPGPKRLWAIVGAMLGTVAGALAFMSVFLFFGMLSVGFSPLPVPVMFGLSLLATGIAIAWVMSLRYRRLR